MNLLGLEQVTEDRERGVNRVEQPEVGDVGGGEIGEALIFLTASPG
jgi:hypothetical protein